MNNTIPYIHVGSGNFSIQRLQIIIDTNIFTPVAIVDLDKKKTYKNLSKINYKKIDLKKRIFKTISEAHKKHEAKACFIFASSDSHANLCIESLRSNLHTYCVKSVALNKIQFKKIMNEKNKRRNLVFFQGYNNQWNEASLKMQEWINSKDGIGQMIGGKCICWGRQDLSRLKNDDHLVNPGMFFHTLACHQLSQLIAAKGLPNYVTSISHNHVSSELGYKKVFGTTGGQCIFEYPNNVPFSYIGSRAAHSNPYGFASRWSGQWIIHGKNGDLIRQGGRLTLYKKGFSVRDVYLKDLDEKLKTDEIPQIKIFHQLIKKNKKMKKFEENSINTWVLLEACNESARIKKRISLKDFKKKLLKNK
tara:strand:- start:47 stop:1132 length:1086 start_codon:yes stop_codon:yes gene_type:complete